MDPDAALAALRALVVDALAQYEGDAHDIAAAFDALDTWLTGHGMLPAAWDPHAMTESELVQRWQPKA